MPSKIRDNAGSKTTVFQTDCAKLNILINIHYAFQLPEQDGMPVLEMLLQAICEKLPKKAIHGRQIAFRAHTAPNSPLRTQRIKGKLLFLQNKRSQICDRKKD